MRLAAIRRVAPLAAPVGLVPPVLGMAARGVDLPAHRVHFVLDLIDAFGMVVWGEAPGLRHRFPAVQEPVTQRFAGWLELVGLVDRVGFGWSPVFPGWWFSVVAKRPRRPPR